MDPGRVRIALGPQGASISCERPDASIVLLGRPADEAAALVPSLYALCSRAQGLAARLAIAAARGTAQPEHTDPEAAAEAAREHAWRLLFDWPRILDFEVERHLFAKFVREIGAGARRHWDIPQWIDSLEDEGPPTNLLPHLDAAASAREWPALSEDFAQAPTWRRQPAETGPLARAHPAPEGGVGTRSRVLARARELQAYLQGNPGHLGRASAVPLARGAGRAAVETARGMLLHEAELENGRVTRYVIVAPTEWNFHPQGPLAQAAGWPAASGEAMQRRRIERMVLALDPCVPWEVELGS